MRLTVLDNSTLEGVDYRPYRDWISGACLLVTRQEQVYLDLLMNLTGFRGKHARCNGVVAGLASDDDRSTLTARRF